jgi:hypothetical protein
VFQRLRTTIPDIFIRLLWRNKKLWAFEEAFPAYTTPLISRREDYNRKEGCRGMPRALKTRRGLSWVFLRKLKLRYMWATLCGRRPPKPPLIVLDVGKPQILLLFRKVYYMWATLCGGIPLNPPPIIVLDVDKPTWGETPRPLQVDSLPICILGVVSAKKVWLKIWYTTKPAPKNDWW